jgi:hypothetical protein
MAQRGTGTGSPLFFKGSGAFQNLPFVVQYFELFKLRYFNYNDYTWIIH